MFFWKKDSIPTSRFSPFQGPESYTSDLGPSSGGGFWVACRRGSISVRVSCLTSSPSRVTLSEWVRKWAVHFWIQSSALASFPSPSGEAACHIHLRPHGQLILTSVNNLLVLYFPVIFFIPLIPCLTISFFLPMSLLSSRLFCCSFFFPLGFPLCLFLL